MNFFTLSRIKKLNSNYADGILKVILIKKIYTNLFLAESKVALTESLGTFNFVSFVRRNSEKVETKTYIIFYFKT